MSHRPVPGDPDFWEYARGNSDFSEWISKVDVLCERFLNQDLMSVPTLSFYNEFDLEECYERDVTPIMYFIEMLEQLKMENGSDLIDGFVAQQAKWGSFCPV